MISRVGWLALLLAGGIATAFGDSTKTVEVKISGDGEWVDTGVDLKAGETIRITASFGVVGFSPEPALKHISPEALLNQADERLYQAKKNGRDRVVSGPFVPVAVGASHPKPAA